MLGELVTRSQQKITWLFSQYCTKQRLVNRKEKILDHCYFHKSSGQETLSSNSAQGLSSPYKLWILIGSTVRRNRGDRLWGLELVKPIGDFRVTFRLCFKASPGAKPFIWKLVLFTCKFGFIFMWIKLHIISCQIEGIKIIFHSETVASFLLSLTVPATCHSRVPDALWAPIERCIR